MRIKVRLRSALQIAHLRAKGAKIGRGFSIGANSHVSLDRGAKLVIGDDVFVDRDTEIVVQKNAKMTIGDSVYIGRRNVISAQTELSIGTNGMTAHQVTIIDSNHGYLDREKPMRLQESTAAPVVLEQDVWLSTGVVVLPGVRLGSRTVVAANSVVTKSFEGNGVVGGMPAVSLKTI
jgi:acetyltransferase-like isoleucine patch superfamily enzyme